MKFILTLSFAFFTSTAFAQSHGHINAGAADTNGNSSIDAGDRLFMYFEPGTQLTALAYNQGVGTYAADGYLWNGYTTFTALHQSSFPSEAPNYHALGALSGSFLSLSLVSIEGPVGARLAFYDSGSSDPAWVYQIGTGLLSGDGSIALTQQSWFDGSPEDGIPSDPFGHIHGRMFGTDSSGDFTATWILTDTQNGVTGLLDSIPFTSSFSALAIPEPSTWLLLAGGAGLLIFLQRSKARR